MLRGVGRELLGEPAADPERDGESKRSSQKINER
jgi:hypothetical protein